MAGTWTTNTTLDEIARRLAPMHRVLVLTHLKPDGDALGSTLAVVRALNQSATWSSTPRAEVWYYGPMPPWARDVIGDTPCTIAESGMLPDASAFDAIVILDTGSWSQVEPARSILAGNASKITVIDHHMQGDADVADGRFIDTSAAAACQPAAELCRLLLGVAGIDALPAPIAHVLYLGLATDTGWFRHSNVTRKVMTTAGALLDAGADHVELYRVVEQRESVARLKLLARALASLEVHGCLAVMTLLRKDFAETGAQAGESGGFVDFGQAISGVEVTALLTEAGPGEYGSPGPVTKVSLRSKPGPGGRGGVDVNVVAKQLGGGGHVRAAGARPDLPMEMAKRRVIELVERQAGG